MAQLINTSINGNLTVTGTTSLSKAATCTGNDVGFFIGNNTYSTALIMGSGGTNRGLYDYTLDKWMLYANASTVQLNGNAATATVASKLGTVTVGGTAKPIYLSSGAPAACSATVGGTATPVYLSSGTITKCSSSIGGTATPVYLSSGTVTKCSSTLGDGTKAVYLNGGTLTECLEAYCTSQGEGEKWTYASNWTNDWIYVYKSPMTGICQIRFHAYYKPTADVAARATINVGTADSGFRPGGTTVGSFFRDVTGAGAIGTLYMNSSGVIKIKINAALTANTSYGVFGSIWIRE